MFATGAIPCYLSPAIFSPAKNSCILASGIHPLPTCGFAAGSEAFLHGA